MITETRRITIDRAEEILEREDVSLMSGASYAEISRSVCAKGLIGIEALGWEVARDRYVQSVSELADLSGLPLYYIEGLETGFERWWPGLSTDPVFLCGVRDGEALRESHLYEGEAV